MSYISTCCCWCWSCYFFLNLLCCTIKEWLFIAFSHTFQCQLHILGNSRTIHWFEEGNYEKKPAVRERLQFVEMFSLTAVPEAGKFICSFGVNMWVKHEILWSDRLLHSRLITSLGEIIINFNHTVYLFSSGLFRLTESRKKDTSLN